MIESFGNIKIPFKMIRDTNDGSEGFYFRPSDMGREIILARDVAEDAKSRNLMMAQTLDGATLSKKHQITMAGLKFNDSSNPLTSSRNDVTPLLCVMGGEKKKNVRGIFSILFAEIAEAAHTILPRLLGIMAIWIVTNCDMSCEWKLAGCGGAAKNARFPCTKCPIESTNLAMPTYPQDDDESTEEERIFCNWCYAMGHDNIPEWECRHHKMCTPEHLKTLRSRVKRFEKDMPAISKQIEEIWDESHIAVRGDPRVPHGENEKDDLSSIHFDLEKATRPQRKTYSTNLTEDLALRDLSLKGSLVQRQAWLFLQHVSEWTYHDASKTVKKFGQGNANSALVMMMDLVPCILHMEIRLGIKILTMCLKDGFTNAKKGTLAWMPDNCKGSDVTACHTLKAELEKRINREMLGTVTNQAQ